MAKWTRTRLAAALAVTAAVAGYHATSPRADAQPGPAPTGPALPIPDAPFKGVANRTLEGSKPDFPKPVTAPQGRAERPPDPGR